MLPASRAPAPRGGYEKLRGLQPASSWPRRRTELLTRAACFRGDSRRAMSIRPSWLRVLKPGTTRRRDSLPLSEPRGDNKGTRGEGNGSASRRQPPPEGDSSHPACLQPKAGPGGARVSPQSIKKILQKGSRVCARPKEARPAPAVFCLVPGGPKEPGRAERGAAPSTQLAGEV